MKRSKRQAFGNKRQASGSKAMHGGEISSRKISEVLLDFAEPMFATVPDDVSPKQLEQLLITPITIWNSIVLEELGDMPGALARARAPVVLGGTPFMVALFDTLAERKRRYFADDCRLIGRHRVRRAPDGSLSVQVEARWLDRSAGPKNTRS